MNLPNAVVVTVVVLLLTGCQTLSNIMPGKRGEDPVVITEPEQPAVIQSTLNEGETLWDFAERTTGSGFNWEKIAVLNSIKDERNVDAGIVLIVPPELALDELKNQ